MEEPESVVEPDAIISPGEPVPDPAYRLCVTVAMNPFMLTWNPNAVIGRCCRCRNPIWADAAQDLPEIDGALPFRPLCIPCALADPEIRDGMRDWFPAAVIEYYTQGTTSAWKDGKRMRPPPPEGGSQSL